VSTQLYTNLAANRRLLASGLDVEQAVLREMLANALEACEVLSLALDECQDVLERLVSSPPARGDAQGPW
jgi:hypothetical protein